MRYRCDGIPNGAAARADPLVEDLRQVALKHGVHLVAMSHVPGSLDDNDVKTLLIDNHEGEYAPGVVATAFWAAGLHLLDASSAVREYDAFEAGKEGG